MADRFSKLYPGGWLTVPAPRTPLEIGSDSEEKRRGDPRDVKKAPWLAGENTVNRFLFRA